MIEWGRGQALVEWAITAFVLVLFALSIIAVGQVVSEYMAVRSAAVQAAYAAARAPSAAAAQSSGEDAARQAMDGSEVSDFNVSIDTGSFQRGTALTARTSGCVDLHVFPVVAGSLGECVQLRWDAHALIEPYRSHTP